MSEIDQNQEKPILFPNFIESQPLLDDSRINDTIKTLLKAFPDTCWGGSSVLYDVILPPTGATATQNKSWDSRDFDVYCLDKDYYKIILFLKTCPMVYLFKTIPIIKKMSAVFLCGAWVGVGDKSAFTTDIKRIRRKKHKCLWLLCSMICYFPRKNLAVPVFFLLSSNSDIWRNKNLWVEALPLPN